MENTQTFNTKKGINKVLKDLHVFLANYQKGKIDKVSRHKAILAYQQLYNDASLFPPCNLTNSLYTDISQFKVNNIKSDVMVIKRNQDKLFY